MQAGLDILYSTWIPLAALALGIAVILVALTYMLGNALSNDRMKGWAKLELVEIFYSAVIIAIVAGGALTVIDSLITASLGFGAQGPSVWIPEFDANVSLCGPDIATNQQSPFYKVTDCHMRLGMWFMHELFKETSDFAYKDYLAYIYTAMAADFTMNFEFITEAAGFFSVAPWRGFFTMGNTIKALVFDYAIKLMVLAKFQEMMLAFIAKALFPALFVVGAILRTFTFSRRLGGLLLAMAISLYYVFPMFYAFGGLVMIDLKNQVLSDPIKSAEFRAVCSGISKDACDDPPISNIMYINGTILIPGGNLNSSEALDAINKLESKSASERMLSMESKDQGSKPLDADATLGRSGADFGKVTNISDREENMLKARNSTETWFKQVSSQSKFDSGVFIAFEPGGPVDVLSRIAFFSVFFSLFGILATIAAIRSLSVTFGGDIEIAGLTHLI